MIFPNPPIIIGITGGSGSGKTTIARGLVNSFTTNCAILISEDDYYKDVAHLSGFGSPDFDFDTPEIRDHELLLEHIKLFKQGMSFKKPIYDFVNHCRSEKTQTIEPCDIWVIEGTHALHNHQIRKEYDLTIFVHAEESIRFERRLRRDIEERGRTEESVKLQFEKFVRPGHEKWTEPQKAHAQIIINGGQNIAPISDIEMENAIKEVKKALFAP